MGSARAGVWNWLVAVSVAAILVVIGLSEHRGSAGSEQLGYALLTVGGLALAARRRAPVAALVVSGLCAVGYEQPDLARC